LARRTPRPIVEEEVLLLFPVDMDPEKKQTPEESIAEAVRIVAPYKREGVSAVEELLAEPRGKAAMEDEDVAHHGRPGANDDKSASEEAR
jgi:hypothetical protein